MSLSPEDTINCPGSPTASAKSKASATDATFDVESCSEKPRSPWRWLTFWRTRESTESKSTQGPPKHDPYGTITRNLDQDPEGYPQVATFKCSDPNFLQFRSFSYVHTRVLLALQQDIETLESFLDALDEFDALGPGDPHKLSSWGHDKGYPTPDKINNVHFRFSKTRPQVIGELKEKLLEYDTVLLKTKQVLTLQKPSNKDYKNVRYWLLGRPQLDESELKYVLRKEDIITLRTGRESAAFDGAVERLVYHLDTFFRKRFKWNIIQDIFLTPELREKTANKQIHYYAPSRLDAMVNIIITFSIFILMVLPVVSLYEMSDTGTATPFEAIGVLIVFTLLFGCAMSGLTNASRQELFAASAAYCAVLVVFIGNFQVQTVNVKGRIPGVVDSS